MKKPDGRAVDLLSGDEVTLLQIPHTQTPSTQQNPVGLAVSTPTEEMANNCDDAVQVGTEMRFLQAVKVPAGHQKLVRRRISSDTDGGPLLEN